MRHTSWVAWVLCLIVISASLDDVPDDPAILKQVGRIAFANSAGHVQSPLPLQPRSVPGCDFRAIAGNWRALPQSLELPSFQSFESVLYGADPSPPAHHT